MTKQVSMKKHMAIAVLSGLAMMTVLPTTIAQVAGSTTLSVSVDEMKDVALGLPSV